MQVEVILSEKSGRYHARIRDWPEVFAEENTRDKAIESVSKNLVEFLSNQVEVVRIDIPIKNGEKNPWVTQFGRFSNDPTYDEFLEEIAGIRQQIDIDSD